MGKTTKKERKARRQQLEETPPQGLCGVIVKTAFLALLASMLMTVAISVDAPGTAVMKTFLGSKGIDIPFDVPKIDGPTAGLKKSSTFDEFYTSYLSQHINPVNKLLHLISCLCATAVWLLHSQWLNTVLILISSACVGCIVFASTLAAPHHFIELAALFGTALLLSSLTGTGKLMLFSMIIAYFFVCLGNFFYELNAPDTLAGNVYYPTYSIIGGFKFSYQLLTGAVPLELPVVQATVVQQLQGAGTVIQEAGTMLQTVFKDLQAKYL